MFWRNRPRFLKWRTASRVGAALNNHISQVLHLCHSRPKFQTKDFVSLSIMVNNSQSIRNFFAPRQPVKTTTPPATSSPSRHSSASNSNASAPETPATVNSTHPLSSAVQGPTSSLSPPPPSSDAMVSSTPAAAATPNVDSSAGKSSRIVRSSDSEDNSDSDSSLEDLSTIIGAKNSAQQASPPTTIDKAAPSTPTAQRTKKEPYNFLKSPLMVQPKYKFDLKSLVKEAEHDVATEASSKRVKAMMAPPEERDAEIGNHLDSSKLTHGALLESVVAGKEDGGMQKVQRALMRTEATSVNKCWHFFDTQKSSKPARRPFPSKAVPQDWKTELSKPDMRNQSFVSGFAEDMVSFGKLLPDEIFLWILDEACHESDGVLRTSYFNTLGESTQQIKELISPKLIEQSFQKIGGTSTATTLTAKIKPDAVPVADYFLDHDWAPLRFLIRFYQHAADSLEKESRRYLICLLLRMSADQIVDKNVDVLDLLQATIRRLCKYIRGEDEWESYVRNLLSHLYSSNILTTLKVSNHLQIHLRYC